MERVSPAQNESFHLWQVFTKKVDENQQFQKDVQRDVQKEERNIQVELGKSEEIVKKKREMEIDIEVAKLRMIDIKVKAHELAHSTVGGQYAGAPHYQFVLGPDGKLYAVAGDVPIDVSPEDTPEKTIRKMQQVIAAALAPADPSPQDIQVASIAAKILAEAISELSRSKEEELNGSKKEGSDKNEGVKDKENNKLQWEIKRL
ncbi:putative metalloprotease CJM1_0395 family protein [Desulfurobacterium crinifex]